MQYADMLSLFCRHQLQYAVIRQLIKMLSFANFEVKSYICEVGTAVHILTDQEIRARMCAAQHITAQPLGGNPADTDNSQLCLRLLNH